MKLQISKMNFNGNNLLLMLCMIIAVESVPINKNHTCYKYSEYNSDEYEYDDFTISPNNNNIDLAKKNYQQEPEIVQCQDDFNFCFAIWSIDLNGTKYIKKQGCWQENDKSVECLQRDCAGALYKNNIYYCCCQGANCNKNITAIDPIEAAESVKLKSTQIPIVPENKAFWFSSIFLICISIITFIVISTIFFIIYNRPKKLINSEQEPLSRCGGTGYTSNLQNVDNLKVISKLGQGKYGTVWKGMINEKEVAVKIFPSQYKQYFINEKNIYSLPLMNSPSLLEYFGCDERRTLDDNIEYFLVLSLAPLGCLQDWLMENTPNYGIFCKMASTICHGISHLHTEIKRGYDQKPCVCHRDLNTRNILVKADLSCCISDFGFALKAYGSKYEYKGEILYAETKSISEVGTLRYMAPEILEGAVNLRDCETALKQIDVYSLGLVLWELSVRCQDLYSLGQAVPPYKAPYEAEIGKHPTFEQMQVLVARHKARPLFPPGWGGGQSGKITRDTCEDCWDHDAEARLTALCAEERMLELVSLRPRSYVSRGPSPPLSANNLVSTSSKSPSKLNYKSITNTYTNENNIITTPPNQIILKINSDTECTLVNMTPSSATEKNHFIFSQQIQPYQGRNPCQERNLAPPGSNNKNNQILIKKSKKHSFLENGQGNSLSCLEDDVSVEDLISATNCNKIIEETSIMGEGFKKQNNTDKKLKGWHGVRALIQKKLFRKDSIDFVKSVNLNEHKSNLPDNSMSRCNLNQRDLSVSPTADITVNFLDGKKNLNHSKIRTVIDDTSNSCTTAISKRPCNLDLTTPINVQVNGLSPENNKLNLIRNISDEYNSSLQNNQLNDLQLIKNNDKQRIKISQSGNLNLSASNDDSDEKRITRQRSLEIFKEVFTDRGSNQRLRNLSQRIKTPGDVPASVRKVRASKTLSLYDDRMMDPSCLL